MYGLAKRTATLTIDRLSLAFERLLVEPYGRDAMSQRKPPPAPKKRVWRITEAAPLGEFVDPLASPAPRTDLPEISSSGGWIVSSFELLHGADVSEDPQTVPGDLFDELFPPTKPPKLN
jgi:hypothetical protein